MTFVTKLTYIVDEAFKIFCTFLITFIWSLYIKKELFPALIISIVVSIVMLTIFHIIFSNKKQKENLKKEQKQNYINFCYKLKLASKEERLEFFSLIYPNYEKIDYALKKDDEIIYPALKENLSEDDLFSVCSCFSNCSTINIICFSFAKSVELLSKKIEPLKVTLTPLKEVFNINNETATKFSPTLNISNKKLYNFKLLIITAFSKDKAKKYLLLSFILILSMFASPSKLLYAILASTALICALICKLNIIK